MINQNPTTRMPVPFAPIGGGAGLLEKRVRLYTQLSLTDLVGLIGNYNHYVDEDIWLADTATHHDNHASDPGVSAITLAQNAGFNWSRSRGISEALELTDYAHAYLLGLGGGGGGSGDPDLSKHDATFISAMVSGQPVYVSGNNSVGPACADDTDQAEAVGLVLVGASEMATGTYITEGSITKPDWTAVTGTESLTPTATYYLDTTAGLLTMTAPTDRYTFVVRIGKAISTTEMVIEISVDYLL